MRMTRDRKEEAITPVQVPVVDKQINNYLKEQDKSLSGPCEMNRYIQQRAVGYSVHYLLVNKHLLKQLLKNHT